MTEENEELFIRRFCAGDEVYEKGKALRDGGDVLSLDRTESGRSKRIYISGSVRDGQELYGPWMIHDQKEDRLTSYFCQCGHCGSRYGGMCEHCAALLFEYGERYSLAGQEKENLSADIPGIDELLDVLPQEDHRRGGGAAGEKSTADADTGRTRYLLLDDPYGEEAYEPEEIDDLLDGSFRRRAKASDPGDTDGAAPLGRFAGAGGVTGADRSAGADGSSGYSQSAGKGSANQTARPGQTVLGGAAKTSGGSLTEEGYQSFRGFEGTIGEWLESIGATAWGTSPSSPNVTVIRQNTDKRLTNLIRDYSVKKRLTEQDANGIMDLIPTLTERRSTSYGYYYHTEEKPQLKLTFHISNDDGKTYLVKNIRAFADAIQQEKAYSHGKFISFVHSKSMFTERGWQYCTLILDALRRDDSSAYVKELTVQPRTLDRLMELNAGREIAWYFEGQRDMVPIRDENPPIRVSIRQIGGEYTVEFGTMRILEGEKYSYILIDGTCYRPKQEFLRDMGEWLTLLSGTTSRIFDIGEQDMPSFCAAVVPTFQKYDLVEFEGFSPEEFMPKIPVFSFYVDEENGIVQIKSYVAYGEMTYNLLHENGSSGGYRDISRERRVRMLVDTYFPEMDVAGEALCFESEDDDRMYRLLTLGLSQLQTEGKVYVTDRIRAHRIINNPRAQVGIAVAGGLLELSVVTEEFPREELAGVIESYRQKKKYHRLRDGSFLNIQDNAVTGIAELMDGMSLSDRQISADHVEVPKYWAAYLDQSLKMGSGQLRVERGRDYKAIIRQMNNIADSDYAVPASLSGILRSYQKTGYRWMRVLTELGFGGILADDMGLGKTLQTITCLLARKQEGELKKPCLVVCPASLIYNWQKEFERFAPEMTVQVITGNVTERMWMIRGRNFTGTESGETGSGSEDAGTERNGIGSGFGNAGAESGENGSRSKDAGTQSDGNGSRSEDAGAENGEIGNGSGNARTESGGNGSGSDNAGTETDGTGSEISRACGADVWITSYDMLKRDIEEYREISFDTEVIDESQNIKNQNTLAAKAVKQIRADTRFALTGTPIENRLSELWSCFDYLMPGILGTYGKFRKKFEIPIVQNRDEDTLARLKRMVSPFILRRMKQDVLKELPDKLEQVVYAKMEGEQRRLYAAHATRLYDSIRGKSAESFREDRIQILAEMTKLRQICCDPSLLFEDYHDVSCKMDTCIELVREAVEGKHKVLIFSQFTSLFPLLEERLREEEIAWYELTGKTPKRERQQLTEAFNSDDVPVLLISLKAGGTGLNLTAATIVIHFDPWWNLAAQNQATDRAHRIGQENQVVVFKLIAQDTIEEKILNLQEKKGMLADQVLDGGQAGAGTLTREDLMEILQMSGCE